MKFTIVTAKDSMTLIETWSIKFWLNIKCSIAAREWDGMLLSNKKEQTIDPRNNLNESPGNYAH